MNFCAIARADVIYSRYFINVVIVFNSCSDLSWQILIKIAGL